MPNEACYLGSLFLKEQADKNIRNQLLEHALSEAPLNPLSHRALFIRSVLGI